MKRLFRNKDIILGNIIANNHRQTITSSGNGLLIVSIYANNYDKHCMKNYYGNCSKELNYLSYVDTLIKELEQNHNNRYYNFQILIFMYGTTFHIIDKVINQYNEYLKDNILFRIYIEEVNYHTNITKYLI